MKRICLIPEIALLLFVSTWAAAYSSYDVIVGGRITISESDVAEVNVSDQNIVRVNMAQNGLLVTGVAEGTGAISITRSNGTIRTIRVNVYSEKAPKEVQAEVTSLLKGRVDEIKTDILGGDVVLMGTVNSWRGKVLLDRIKEMYPQIQDLIDYKVPRPSVQIDVRVYEIDVDGASKIGIDWQALTEHTISFLEDMTRQSDINQVMKAGPLVRQNPFDATIHTMISDGVARELAKPKLVTSNGGQARFRVGGKVPYRILDKEGNASVQFQDYGIAMEIEPRIEAMGGRYIDLKMGLEISHLDYTVMISDNPGLIVRSNETDITLRHGATMAIAGLLFTRREEHHGRLPILGRLPWLGNWLFGYTSTKETRVETLVLVTPYILIEGSQIGLESPGEFKGQLEDEFRTRK